jgi:hypothetical protein
MRFLAREYVSSIVIRERRTGTQPGPSETQWEQEQVRANCGARVSRAGWGFVDSRLAVVADPRHRPSGPPSASQRRTIGVVARERPVWTATPPMALRRCASCPQERLCWRDGSGCQAHDIVRGEQCRSQAPYRRSGESEAYRHAPVSANLHVLSRFCGDVLFAAAAAAPLFRSLSRPPPRPLTLPLPRTRKRPLPRTIKPQSPFARSARARAMTSRWTSDVPS